MRINITGRTGPRGFKGERGYPGKDGVIAKMIAALLAAMLLFLGLIVFWMTYPYKTVVFNQQPFKVDTKVVKAGESLTYTVDYCKYTDITPTVTRHIANGFIFQLSASAAVKKDVGCGKIKVHTLIPSTIPPDTYHLKVSYAYKVNPIREVYVYAETEEFQVIK